MAENFQGSQNFKVTHQKVRESCPSNIALIKYWGKYEGQIPANPSISYTLNHCKTNTEIEFFANENFSVQTFLAGKEEVKFAEKIEKYFKNIEKYLPWILKGKYIIKTENTFPHSSGIASSASGFGAIAKCLVELDLQFTSKNQLPTSEFQLSTSDIKKASFLARLGSGSACRSLYDGLVVWGKTETVENSSDLFSVQYPNSEIHPVFKKFNDWVLLVHEGEKSVSSTVGHALMDDNAYAEKRFAEAHENFKILKDILKTGDMKRFITLVEHEALTLHAMMMMSNPAYILMKSGTLEIINKIWEFRKESGLPLFFTLDAGANVHVLFPENENSEAIKSFINEKLLSCTQNGNMVKDEMKF